MPRSRTSPSRASAALIAVIGVLALLLTGCGQSAPSGEPAPTTSAAPSSSTSADVFPRDVDVDGTTVHVEEKPSSIVILGPSLTETAYAVGAGPQVKAVDKLSTFPADAAVSDLDAFTPSAEAVAAQNPDLVLVSGDANNLVAGLTKLKIPVAVLGAPADLDAALAQFTLVGQLTGNTAAAQALATQTQTSLDQAVASVEAASSDGATTSYYWELDPTFYSVTSKTFIGSILGEFGLTNIADKAPKAAGGYPQLSAEFIIDADPDVIFLADGTCCQQSAATVAKRAGWDVTRAVKDPDGVVVIDDDIASRWGPRIADLATTVAASLTKLQS